MATVNKSSLRAEFDALKARFESLCAAGKMSAESRALFDALLMLFELLMAVFMEKHTPKSPANSGLPPSQSPNDATARSRPGDRRPYRDEADIESFFDSLDRTRLEEMLQIRVADGSLRRLVGKCVRVGVLDGEERTEPERGTPQGSGLSPLLGNLYLHHTLDVWFEREVKPRLGGEAVLVRYCDDFVIGFERREDAQRVPGGELRLGVVV